MIQAYLERRVILEGTDFNALLLDKIDKLESDITDVQQKLDQCQLNRNFANNDSQQHKQTEQNV